MRKYYLAALQSVPRLGSVKIRQLVDFFGSPEALWQASAPELRSSGLLGEKLSQAVAVMCHKTFPEQLAEEWSKAKIGLTALGDRDYPPLLAQTFNPPIILYYKGRLPVWEKTLAMVGARKATIYGKNVARQLAEELAAQGVCIISGAARGIDTASHQGALQIGTTVAVLGNGVNIVYPPENARLLQEIAEKGAVLSEFAPDMPPLPGQFPARNRIISGLSQGVLIVEAAIRSGSLITADFALEEGRDVFATPGSIFSEQSQGCHALIKMGAKLVESAKDVLEEYNWQLPESPKNESAEVLTKEELELLAALRYDAVTTMDDILEKTGMTPSRAAYLLLQLELSGYIMPKGQQYLRIKRGGAI